MAPKKIGRYVVIRELGRGGMATVYHARDPRFKREVAVKVLPKELLHNKRIKARFERESQTIASLEHHAIVPVYDGGEYAGQQPFRADTPTKVMMKHVLDPVPHIRDYDPRLPDGVDEVLARAMAKDKDDRYASAGELAAAIQAIAFPESRGKASAPETVVSPKRGLIPPRLFAKKPIQPTQSKTWVDSSEKRSARSWIMDGILALVGVIAVGFLGYEAI